MQIILIKKTIFLYSPEIVRQANLLLEQLNAGSSLSCVEDINAAVYVTLFEGLCGEKLHGKTGSAGSRGEGSLSLIRPPFAH